MDDPAPKLALPAARMPSLWRRRRFLQLAAGSVALVPLGILGCGGEDEAAVSSGATERGALAGTKAPETSSSIAPASATPVEPSQSPTPSPTSTQAPPSVAMMLDPAQVGLGESMRVQVQAPGASTVLVDFRDVSYHMLRQADGSFWLTLGVPLDAPTGAGALAGTARDASGAALASGDATYEVVTVERPVDYLELTEGEASVLTPDAGIRESELRGLQFAQFDPLPRWSELLLRPVDGPITTYFGQGRSINGGPIGQFHTGVDLANDEGTPVQVAAPGRVSWTGEMPIRGNSVIVDHGGGAKTGYHHLSVISSNVGQEVAAGEIIGLVGMTGLATGPHLHWELTLWGVNVDPMTWLVRWFGP